jgi:DNA-binding CsgD family transcriptional regulator
MRRSGLTDAYARLTDREKDVLAWVAEGKSNAEIGQILSTRARTVAKHLEHIFTKLGVESRTAAARVAFEVMRTRGSPSRRPSKQPKRRRNR